MPGWFWTILAILLIVALVVFLVNASRGRRL